MSLQKYCDVLVIGGGETGIRAAVEAKRQGAKDVLLVTKSKYGSSGVMFSNITFGWDMQAATSQNDPTDNKEVHLKDIMNASQGTANEKMARILTEEAPYRVKDLEQLFDLELYRRKDGSERQVYGCFSTKDRSYQFVHPDEIKKKVADSIHKYGVELFDECMVTDLVIQDGKCIGAYALDRENQVWKLHAGATILAAGGATGMYEHNFACEGMTGDGYALALRAGCTLANMEFMQFGLGLLEPKYRALFLDRLMYLQPTIEFEQEHHFPLPLKDILTMHSKHFPFSTIDASYLFDVAVFEETLANHGKGVSVDLSVIPLEKLEEIPVWDLYYHYFDEDKDPYTHKLRITTFAHACNGGVKIDENAATGIEGLYAAGEMITGPHGANRLGGNMHAACQVFGTRAGKNATQYAQEHMENKEMEFEAHPTQSSSVSAKEYSDAKIRIGKVLWENANVKRNAEGLEKALQELAKEEALLKEGVPSGEALWDYYELRNTILASKAIVQSAYERNESRGGHYRSDFPQTDETSYVVECKYEENEPNLSVSRTPEYTIS